MFPSLSAPADSISVSQLQQQIQEAVALIPASESVALSAGMGRILSEDVRARVDVPPFDNSAMDGYAFAFDDLPGKAELRIVGESFAGKPFRGRLESGDAIRIMTGALLPAGANCVVAQEHARMKDSQTLDMRGIMVRAGQNCRLRGEDLAMGKVALAKGTRLGAAELGLLASFGTAAINVQRRLRVAIFSSGDELRNPDQALDDGGIYDSNRIALRGMLHKFGAQVADLGILKDDPAAIDLALRHAAGQVDAIITSGAMSTGAADYLRQVLEKIGTMQFWNVNMRPGRPFAFGHLTQHGRSTYLFGLPGNPVAMMVGFYFFVRPALQKINGAQLDVPLSINAVATHAMAKKVGRTEFQRGICKVNASGNLVVCASGEQGSAMISSMTRANCLIMLAPEQ